MSRHSGRRRPRHSARSARARDRHAAQLFGPLSPREMDEARGYLVSCLEQEIERAVAELARLRGALAALPGGLPGSDAYAAAADLETQITAAGLARGELVLMLDAVRAGRRFGAPGGLAIAAIRAPRHELLTRAAETGEPVDAAALGEIRRREQMIASWLLEFEPTA